MMIDTPTLGRVAFVAIGATLVGSLAWTVAVGDTIKKGDELGYFAFGGSTCISVFQDGTVTWDADLLANGRRSLESLVRVGERIGMGTCCAAIETQEQRAKVMQRTDTLLEQAGVEPLEARPELQRILTGDMLQSPLEGVALTDETEDGVQESPAE